MGSTLETLLPVTRILGVLTCFPHVASSSAEGAYADKRVLGEFDDEGAGPIRGGADADKRALGVVDEGACLIRNFLMRSAQGHPRAHAAHASL